MLKKSSILLIPHTRICSAGNPINASSSRKPPHCPLRRWLQHFHTSPWQHHVVAKGYSSNCYDTNLRWPEATSGKGIPTPYQIFNQRKGAPYSKSRFYELVKLYHPDKHGVEEGPEDLPRSIKLERYRLVVAANEILSCPIKRGAYDAYGAGWNGFPSAKRPDSPAGGWGSGGRAWKYPNGTQNNATWEDWEAWRNPQSEGQQRSVFVSNTMFVTLTVFAVALGLMGQAMRVDSESRRYMDKRDRLHAEASEALMKSRRQTRLSVGGPEDRITRFLRLRNEGLLGTDMEHKMLILKGSMTDENEDDEGKEVSDNDSGKDVPQRSIA